ncbi:MAG TPA: SpoIIE family protein phosphatase [Candidatus Baltobacteraceae bacterium]|nr:SpoIIE family protein phosphatase [Candidatus Baltobacteraceae bacterium]
MATISPRPDEDRLRARGLGVRAQALLLTLVPLLFLIVLLAIAGNLQRATEQATAVSRHTGDVLAQADRVLGLLRSADEAALAYTKSHVERDLAPFRAASADLPVQLGVLRGMTDADRPARSAERRLDADMRSAFALVREYLADVRRHDTAAAAQLQRRPSVRALGQDLESAKIAYDGRERALALAQLSALRISVRDQGRALIGVAALGVVLTLLVALRYGFGTARRLQMLAANAERIGSGEPAVAIPGNDEIARLDLAYRQMAERLRREHRVSSELQRAMLPDVLPSFEGLRLDSAYIPAAVGADIGGDWFDVFDLGEGAIGISVGDVAGHGLRAAAVMGAVRQSIRTAARIENEPSAVLRQVNHVLCADEDGTLVSAFFGVFDRETGELCYAIAGHPPPLIARPDGTVSALAGGGIVLGLDPRSEYEQFHERLEAGYGAVFYTDGIVEVERDYFKGVRDLEHAVLDELANPSSNVADGIQRRVFAHATPRDDSAVLFLGVTAVGGETARDVKRWTLDARRTASARRVKRALMWQLAGLAPRGADLAAAELAFGELLGNVARHTPGPATVSLERRGGAYILHVEDEGPPFSLNGSAPADLLAEGGRGLFLIRTASRDVRVERTASGNRVSVTLPLVDRRGRVERRA